MSIPRAQTGSEPDHEARIDLDAMARRRFTLLCVTYLALGTISLLIYLFSDFQNLPGTGESLVRGWLLLGAMFLAMVVVGAALLLQRLRLRTLAEVTNVGTMMLIIVGTLLVASRLAVEKALPAHVWYGLVDLVVLHLVACAIMPWTAREATLPFAPLMLIWAVTFLVPGSTDLAIEDRVVLVIVSPMLLIPGATLAHWRRRRRWERAHRIALEGRVESMGGELSRARIVHDAMFPPHFTGNVAFEYEYQPIQEIGGDYVHSHVSSESGMVTITLLDVAGHGLAAALTVNRLFGELERIHAEHADAAPSKVMGLLNRYINLTMARHGLFATGACLRIDPSNGDLRWVNAGHPPSFLRRADGTVVDLPTTTLILGVLEAHEFETMQHKTTIAPGDTIIAFTDGAFEARNRRGERFGLDRVRETVRFNPPPRQWPRFIAGAVAQHHDGDPEDDVLIVALTLRSLRVGDAGDTAAGTAAPAAAIDR